MLAILPLLLGLAPEIAKWIGGSQAGQVTASIAGAVKAVTGHDDPDQAAAAIAADPAKAAELRVQLAKISADAETAQRQADLEQLKAALAAQAAERQVQLDELKTSVEDLKGARGMTQDLVKTGSPMAWAAPVLSGIILVGFGFMLWLVIAGSARLEGNNLAIANVLLGTLAAMATQVANFWLGSSAGSKGKDALLGAAQSELARSVPSNLMPLRPGAVLTGPAVKMAVEGAVEELNEASLSRARGG